MGRVAAKSRNKRWTEQDIQLIRGSTAKPWTALGANLYLRVHVGVDGTTYKSFYWRGGRGSKFRSLGSWPEMSLRVARDEVAKVKLRVRTVSSVATFADAASDFFANLKPGLREATRDSLASTYTVHLRDSIGPRKLRDLAAADIAAPLNQLVRKGTRETAIKAASLVRRILDRAVVHGQLTHNVASSFKAEHLGGRNPPRTRVLDDAELRRFVRASHRHPRGNVARFLLATGCRVNETTKAKRSWLDADVLTLPPEVTKQKREHRVTLSTYARQQLKHLDSDTPYLFPSPFHKGRDPQSREAAWLTVSTIAKWAGINGMTGHDLRRTARTRWSELKVDPLVAEYMMGHSMPGLLATYDHARRDTEAAIAWEKWGCWLHAVEAENPST